MFRFGSPARLLSEALVLALFAILTVAGRADAQTPTFNSVIMSPIGALPWHSPRAAAVGDFNGDGKQDAVVVDSSAVIHFLRGNGNATFSKTDLGGAPLTAGNVVGLNPGLFQYLPNPVERFDAVSAADVNGDGRLDAVLLMVSRINWNPASYSTVLINTGNDGNGVPQFAATHYALGFYDVRSLTVGDLNSDSRPDYIIGSAYGGLYVHLNNGSGGFAITQVTTVQPNSGNPAVGPGAIADLNADGRGDFIVTSGQANATNVFLGNGNGTLQAPSILTPAASSVAVGDFNGDGRPDLIEGFNGSVSVYLNTGNGAFGIPISSSAGNLGWPSALSTTDVNGDGKLDVAASLGGAGKIAILPGNGDGTFAAPSLFGGVPNAVDVTLADFTGDGKNDIGSVSANGYGGQNYAVLTNTTVFTPPVVTVFASGISPVIAWDPIFPAAYISPDSAESKPIPTVGYSDPRWVNPHPASVFPKNSHPWEYDGWVPAEFKFNANWINAWSSLASNGMGGPGQSWTKYSTKITGSGDFVLQFLADNASWIYINGELVGFQDYFWPSNGTGRYTITLSGAGPHELSFIIWDGGGAAGGKFRIETVQSFQQNNPGEELPPPPPPSDVTAPVISAPANITAEATQPGGAFVNFNATAADDVDGSVDVVADPVSGSLFAIGTSAVNLTAIDAAGNSATASFTVTVRDTIAPAFTSVPANQTVEATSANGATATFDAADATDAVGVVSITYSKASGSTFPIGTTTVTVTATDAAGNASSKSFTVTVADTTAPTITSVSGNVIAEATSAAGASVAYNAATATDAVGVASITYSTASGATFSLGTTTVTVTATDAAGNSSQATFTVTVRDTTAPAIASLTPSQGSLWPPNHQMVAISLNAVSTDAVGVTSTKIVNVTSSEPDNGLGDGDTAGDIVITGPLSVNLRAERAGKGNGRTYTITVEARDAAGNASTRTTTVFVPKSQGK